MESIEFSRDVVVQPTVCGLASDFQKLTLASNCTTMGELGTIAGIVISVTAWFGYHYLGPWIVTYGRTRCWWS